MISLAIAFVITLIVVLYSRRFIKTSVKRILWAGACGLLTGIVLDMFLGETYGMWYYTHHEYYSADYFYLIYIGWFVFGILVYHASLLLSLLVKNHYIQPIVLTIIVASVNETIGYLRDIWRYNAPFWFIVLGWFIYILVLNEMYHFNPKVDKRSNDEFERLSQTIQIQ